MNETSWMTIAANAVLLPIVAAVAFFAGYIKALRDTEARRKEQTQEAEDKRKEIEADVAKRPDPDLDRDLDKWLRD